MERQHKRRRVAAVAAERPAPAPPGGNSSKDAAQYTVEVGGRMTGADTSALPASRLQLVGIGPDSLSRALGLLSSHGMVVLGPSTLPADYLRSLKTKADEISEEVTSALERRGIAYQLSPGQRGTGNGVGVHSGSAQAFERRHSFRFAEVASRCLGRLDIRHGLLHPPFSDELLSHNPAWRPIVQAVLGREAELEYAGIVLSLPGSAVQAWHVDGTHLFGKKCQCPPHCLDVFVPLMDMTPALGPTEFIPGSHILDAAASLDKLLLSSGTNQHEGSMGGDGAVESIAASSRCAPLLRAGSAVIYDHRLVHRGTANTTHIAGGGGAAAAGRAGKEGEGVARPMLYLMYSKPWFKETLNFDPTNRLFASFDEGTVADPEVAEEEEEEEEEQEEEQEKQAQHQAALR